MLAKFGIGVVAVIHLAFAGLEIFRPEKVLELLLGWEEDLAKMAVVLVQNQGAYNLFFAIGLFAILTNLVPAAQKKVLAIFCLASLAAAGLFGLVSVGSVAGFLKIGSLVFLAQLVPAAIVLWLVTRREA